MHKNKQNTKPVALVILDGFGYRAETKNNAIAQASTPHLDNWFAHYPHTLLQASGAAVGLPEDVMGNSEVGHMTIGAGRIIKQDVVRINEAIKDGSFFSNPILIEQLHQLANTNQALHLIGLLSDASVHSTINHLFAYLKVAKKQGIQKVYIHAFLDGRDVSPKSAQKYLEQLDTFTDELGLGTLASISGRFYSMDRDKNWKRTQKAYESLTEKQPAKYDSWQKALESYYAQGITDEFIPPTQLNSAEIVKSGDGIIFINFRPDRARQLTQAFVAKNFNGFKRIPVSLAFFITPTNYESDQFQTSVLFEPKDIQNTLKEILSEHATRTFAIAETEKYAHVTYFFSGGKEKPFEYETRMLIPSIPAKNYIEHPCMSAGGITKAVLESLQLDPHDFYLINYANADMVGHSGNLAATINAIECLDTELAKLYQEIVVKHDGTLIITSDHGNAEDMLDKNGQPKTAHTTNPVPFLAIKKEWQSKAINLNLKGLADIAPFILKQFRIPIPGIMQQD